MNLQGLLEGLLKSATETTKKNDIRWGQVAAGAGAGAAATGALGLLLGQKRGRSMGGKALKYGSVAALGFAAYKIYQAHQAKQGQMAAPSAFPAAAQQPLLPAPQLELNSQAMLKAIIAAAKADGHVDERERGMIEAELQRQEADPQQRAWLEQELRRPLDPREVAQAASTPDLAAQMYLASFLVADDTSFMERAYLDELARQLQLPDSLKRDLEAQAQAA